MKTVEIIERIEGEAKLSCTWKDEKVSDARIDFLNFRGFEYILEGKAPLDALVYTPRICGICGQAHLKATVDALENIYEKLGRGCWWFVGDPRFMYRHISGLFAYLNGVIFLDTDN